MKKWLVSAAWRVAGPLGWVFGFHPMQLRRALLQLFPVGKKAAAWSEITVDSSRQQFQRLLTEHGMQAAEARLAELMARDPAQAEILLWGWRLARLQEGEGKRLDAGLLASLKNSELALPVGKTLFQMGRLQDALHLLEPLAGPEAGRLKVLCAAQLDLLRKGYALPEKSSSRYRANSGKVLYLLHNSLPYASGGYATRSHGLSTALIELGRDVECVTRLGFPLDRVRRLGWCPRVEEVGRVRYHHLRDDPGAYTRVDPGTYLDMNSAAVLELARRQRPALLHAASNYINGLAAASVGRQLGLPSIYEVRGLWELTRASADPAYRGSEAWLMNERLEREACLEADAVIAITRAMASLLIERGVPEHKVIVVPNGVNTDQFHPRQRDDALRKALGFDKDDVVVTFIGSMPLYEGLEDLLEAFAMSAVRNERMRCLLVGDGPSRELLEQKVKELRLVDKVVFAGRVPHEAVIRYYAAGDVFVYPRKPLPVTEIVSPMKPLEAMAMGKPVLVSSVAAMAEMVTPGKTGLVYEKGDNVALASSMQRLCEDRELRLSIGAAAREWVAAHRDWRQLATGVEHLYERLLSGQGSTKHSGES